MLQRLVLQSTEDSGTAGQGHDVRVLRGAVGPGGAGGQRRVALLDAVVVAAGRAEVLERNPGPVLHLPLVDGEAVGTRRVELEDDVDETEGLTWRICRQKPE